MTTVARATFACALAAVAAKSAFAQGARAAPACAGQVISAIAIRPLPPLEEAARDWWETPVRALNSLHAVTQPAVVRALLLLKVGDPCDEFLRAESERVLRAQPFIARAHIAVHPESGGSVALVVTTQDEFTFILAARFSGKSPYVTALTLGDGNLGGKGMSIAAGWIHTVTREGFGVAYIDYTFTKRPWQLQLAGGLGGVGEASLFGDVSHPFYSDAQRSAWRGSFVNLTLLQAFQRPDTVAFDVGVTRQFGFVGAAARVVGRPGSILLLGGAFSTEEDATGFPASGYDSTVNYDSLFVRYAPRRSVRLNFIAAYRRIHFGRATRLDALNGTQDLRLGFEAAALAGHGFSGLDGSSDDFFANGGVFIGVGAERGYGYLQALIESRRGTESGLWTDAIASCRLRFYRRLSDVQTLVADGELGAGWKTTRPFEIRIGQPDGGVRGYAASHDAGGQRAALKIEDRWYLGALGKKVDIGVLAFADAGRVWAGDVPFGTTTPVKVGVGAGLLAATPVGSQRTYRVDFAVPVSPDPYAGWVVRLTVINVAQLGSTKEPPDVAFGREFVSTSSQFTYPR